MEGFAEYRNSSGDRIMTANKNTFNLVEVEINPPVVATKVRIMPWSKHPRTVCMRLELKGCVKEEEEVVPRNKMEIIENASNELSQVENMTDEPSTETDSTESNNTPPPSDGNTVVIVEGWWFTQYLGAAVGVLLTVILILVVLIMFILNRTNRHKQFPSLTNISIASSFTEDHHILQHPSSSDEEAVYQEVSRPAQPTYTAVGEYMSPVNQMYARTAQDKYNTLYKPDMDTVYNIPINHYQPWVITDLQTLEKQDHPTLVKCETEELGSTPRLPPLPDFDSFMFDSVEIVGEIETSVDSETPIYVNLEHY